MEVERQLMEVERQLLELGNHRASDAAQPLHKRPYPLFYQLLIDDWVLANWVLIMEKLIDTHMAVIRCRDGHTRLMHEKRLQWLLACSKGGQTTQRRKRGHRWTSAEAKSAAAKSRGRLMPSGRHVGRKVKYAPRVNRKALRLLYAGYERLGIRYRPRTKDWVLAEGGRARVISEKTALARLGHVGTLGHMPVEIVRSGLRRGTSLAATRVDG